MQPVREFLSRVRRGPTAVLLGALALAVLLISTRPERPRIELPERAWPVSTMAAAVGEIRPSLELYGRIEARQDARLSAALDGDVLEVLVQDGDSVAQGDLLLVLDDQDARLDFIQRDADFQEIEAQVALERQRAVRNREALVNEQELLTLSENNAERARSLFQNDRLISQANVDDSVEELKRAQLAVTSRLLAIEESQNKVRQLEAQLMRARALRDRAQLEVDRTQIVAPFAGAVSEVDVSVGDRVRVGDGLLRLHNPEALELRAQVPTRYVPRVRSALTNDVVMPANVESGNANYQAQLQRISGQTREGAGSVDAFLKFNEVPATANLGATVRVVLALPAEPNTIAVPAAAVYGRDRIFTVDGQRMASLDVERVGERVLPDGGSEVLIRSPRLDESVKIITTKVASAADGLLVTVSPSGAPESRASQLAVRNLTASRE